MQENRYSRHELLKEVGIEGQKRIAQGRVLIIGAGGLGSPASLYLASSGVKKITIVDSDMVDLFFLLGKMIEYGETEQIFSMPKDKRTEDYITGRFG